MYFRGDNKSNYFEILIRFPNAYHGYESVLFNCQLDRDIYIYLHPQRVATLGVNRILRQIELLNIF